MLILLFIDGSFIELGLPVVAVTLLAREGRRAGTALAAGGAAWTEATAVGRTNIPRPGGQSKYRSPCTDPSFLPESSSNSTPIHSLAAKCVCPMKRIIAVRPSLRLIVCPTW